MHMCLSSEHGYMGHIGARARSQQSKNIAKTHTHTHTQSQSLIQKQTEQCNKHTKTISMLSLLLNGWMNGWMDVGSAAR